MTTTKQKKSIPKKIEKIKSLKHLKKSDLLKMLLWHYELIKKNQKRLNILEKHLETFCEKCVEKRTCKRYRSMRDKIRYIG